MPIDDKQTWIDTVNFLPVADSKVIGAKNLADAVNAATTGKAELQGVSGSVQFSFQKIIFYTQLLTVTNTPIALPGVTKFVQAWVAAIQASTMVVPPGSSFGTPSPATTWSSATTTLDPASLIVAQTTLQADLLKQGVEPVNDSNDSDFGPAFRRAFLNLTYTVSGTNSVSPTTGPLVAPALSLI